jgi:hypothetical protein
MRRAVQAADYLGQDFNAKYCAKHFPLTRKAMACKNKLPEVGGKWGQTPQETMPRHPVSAAECVNENETHTLINLNVA